jgi:hypothetical protein
MEKAIWWTLGILVVTGGAVMVAAGVAGIYYIYSRQTGRIIDRRSACIDDLPEDKHNETRAAIDSKDTEKLLIQAKQASAQGWTCAANQMRDIVSTLNKEKALRA